MHRARSVTSLLIVAGALAAVGSGPAWAQGTEELAELEASLPELSDTERVRALSRLAEGYRATAPERALGFGRRALTLAETAPDDAAQVRSLTEMAWAYMETGRYPEAMDHAQRGLELAAARGVRRGEARALNNLGVINRRTGAFGPALDYFRRSMAIYDELADEPAVATSLNNISVVLGFDLGDFDRSIASQMQALEIRERLGDPEALSQSYNTLGVIYDNLDEHTAAIGYLTRALEGWRTLGVAPRIAATLDNLAAVQTELGSLEEALALQSEALEIREGLGASSGVASSLENLGAILTGLGRLGEARTHLERALQLHRELGERKSTAETLVTFAALERASGRSAAAETLLDEAVTIARELQAAEVERDAERALAETREARGNYRGALEAFRAAERIDDDIFSRDRTRSIDALEAEYQAERAAREIQRLSAEAELVATVAQQRITLLLSAILLALVGFLLYRRGVMTRYQQELERQVDERTSELSEAAVRLEALTLTDALTGLPNRRYLFSTVESDIATVLRAYRANGDGPVHNADLVFYLLDLDDFKSVNDEHGHAVGDRMLEQVAAVLKDTGRASDVVIRWGGEEFLVLTRQVDRRSAGAFAERIRARVRDFHFDDGQGNVLRRTVSVGFAPYPLLTDHPGAVDWETVLGLADQASYVAKRSGRDAWVGFVGRPGTDPAGVADGRQTVERLLQSGELLVQSSLEGEGRRVVFGE